MFKRLKSDLYACGQEGLPREIVLEGRRYRLVRTFKHDFFAATGLYEAVLADKSEVGSLKVLKAARMQPFCGLGLLWLGRWLCRRELEILERLQDMDQVPHLVGRWGQTGFLYDYIEGQSLDEKPPIPDDFFDQLSHLLERLHRRRVCYIDLNKRGNILVGRDGRPYLIDFQISMVFRQNGRICQLLQKEDRYHLLKHKRRLRPDLMSEQERQDSYRKSTWIQIHRFLSWPFRRLRRALMRRLYRRGYLQDVPPDLRSPENDPARFGR
jgi:hypothetical protein